MAAFKGQEEYVVDAKGRLALPAQMRRCLNPAANQTLTMIRGLERCIFLFPKDEWETKEQHLLNLDQSKRENRAYIRMISRWAGEETLDAQGRIRLSRQLMDFAGIEPGQKVSVIGALDHIEVWNQDILDEYFSSQPADFETLAESVLRKSQD